MQSITLYILKMCIGVLLISAIQANGFAQIRKIDSLVAQFNNTKSDSGKLVIANTIGKEVLFQNSELAHKYAKIAQQLALQLNDTVALITATSNIGTYYFLLAVYDSAEFNYLIAYNLSLACKYQNGVALSMLNRGILKSISGQMVEALEFLYKALQLYETLGNKAGMSNAYNNIGIIYDNSNQYAKALEFYQKAYITRQQSGDKRRISQILNNIAIIYSKQKNYEMALQYYFKAIEISRSYTDKKTLSTSLLNVGFVYIEKNDWKNAQHYFNEALQIKREINDNRGIANIMLGIGDTYQIQKKYEQALYYYSECLKIRKKINDQYTIMGDYKVIAETYALLNNYKEAITYLKKYQEVNQKTFNLSSAKKIAEIYSKYEAEKKEKEILLLQKDKEIHDLKLLKNRQIVNIAAIVFCLLSIMLVSLYVLKIKNEKIFYYLKEKNDEIQLQKAEIIQQRNGLEHLYSDLKNKHECAQQQHDIIQIKTKYITDSIRYARLIQEAILPNESVLQHAFADAFILFKPKDIVSGDYYWIEQKNEKIYFALIDSCGHGVAGALISIIGHDILNEAIFEFKHQHPADIFSFFNNRLRTILKENYEEIIVNAGMDVGIFVYDTQTNILEYSGSHNPVYIIRNGELLTYKSNFYPVGVSMENENNIQQFANNSLLLMKNDKVYIYSDGYIDQFGGRERKKFMSKQFRELLLEIHDLSSNNQKHHLWERFKKWQGLEEQVDDVIVFGICI